MSRGTLFARSALAVVILVFIGWLCSAVGVLTYSHTDDARPTQAIVVLGAAQYDGKPSPVLRARLDHGIDLWRRGLAPHFVLTGGRGVGDTTSEAAVGRRYAIRHGVPDTAILIETKGRTTSESMRAVATILRDRGLDSAVFVSDPFHMLRLKIIASRLGLVAYTSPTRTSPISANRAQSWGYIVTESVKVPLALVMKKD